MSKETKQQEHNIIRKIIEYFMENEYDPNDKKMKQKLRDWIADIIKLEAKEMGYTTKVILDDENHPIDLKKVSEMEDQKELLIFFSKNINHCAFSLCTSSKFSTPRVPSLQLSEKTFDDIFEKKSTFPACLKLIHIIFHELHHMRQYLFAQTGVSSYSSLMWTKEHILLNQFYSFYKKNHSAMFIEENADIVATINWIETTNSPYIITYPHTSSYKCVFMKKHREDFMANLVDNLITKKGYTFLLQKYPMLQKEYNDDGQPKSAIELLQNMQSEIKEFSTMDGISKQEQNTLIIDCKAMYFEILQRAMRRATPQEITDLTNSYNPEDSTALFSDMKSYFEHRFEQEKYTVEEYIYFDDDLNGEVSRQKEIHSRYKYFQSKIDFLDTLKQQQNTTLLAAIINKGKKFVRTSKLCSLDKKLHITLSRENTENSDVEQEIDDE